MKYRIVHIKYLLDNWKNKVKSMAKGYYFVYMMLWCLIFALGGWAYYRNIMACFVFMPLSVYMLYLKVKKDADKKKKETVYQFRDLLQTISASLMAGRNIEKSFLTASKELTIIWSAKNTPINKALGIMESRLSMNISMEESLWKMAESLDCEEAVQFAEMFEICKRNGGNIIHAIKVSEQTLTDKLIVLQEINMVIAQRKLELKILLYFPHFMFAFLMFTTDNYLEPLFHNLFGQVLASCVLGLSFLAAVLGRKITDFDV